MSKYRTTNDWNNPPYLQIEMINGEDEYVRTYNRISADWWKDTGQTLTDNGIKELLLAEIVNKLHYLGKEVGDKDTPLNLERSET